MAGINPSLRARFLCATLVLALVLLSGFIYAVHEFVSILETELMQGPLEEEFSEFVASYRRDPNFTEPMGKDFKSYVVPRSDTRQLPAPLRQLRSGEVAQIEIGAGDYVGGRRDVGDTSLYLLMDTEPIERLEARLVTIAWVCGLGALILATLLALWLARLVTRPIGALAERIAAIEPGWPRPVLAPAVHDRELAVIAEGFDRTLERFDAFVAREQAFTEDASHELRTPIAVILSAAELLAADTGLSPKARQRLHRIQIAARQAQELIEALLYLAREDGGGVSENQDLRDIVRTAIDLYADAAADKGLYLRVHGDARPQVTAPRGLLVSMVSNLLHNALEHTRTGGIDVFIHLDRLIIEDSGAGIDPEAIERIFDKRVHGPQSRGQGLGLYLVKRLCKRQGWQVEVENRAAGGARFTLRFGTQHHTRVQG